MSTGNIFNHVNGGKFEVKPVVYSKTNVDVVLNTSVSFGLKLDEMMDLIIENYDKFNRNDFHMFARRIALCDMEITRREHFEKEGEAEDEKFKW